MQVEEKKKLPGMPGEITLGMLAGLTARLVVLYFVWTNAHWSVALLLTGSVLENINQELREIKRDLQTELYVAELKQAMKQESVHVHIS